MFDPNNPYGTGDQPGVWRGLDTGADLEWGNPEQADGANDDPGTPPGPINTDLPFAVGLPYFEGLEDPYKRVELQLSPNPQAWSPNEDVGGMAMIGDYSGFYRTSGPIQAFGHEPSGGLDGDQAIGRIMRFPANAPERFDPYGVFNTDVRDDLQGAMDVDDMEFGTTAEITTNLLQWPNVWGRW